ncbi:30S ribosomal protein S6 [Guggenheimella bovis]
MKKYESIVVFRPDMEDEARVELLEKFKSIIEADGVIESIDEWGKRRLAYEIEKLTEGYYVLINFEANETLPKELERNYRISDKVLRYNVIRKDS